MTRPGPHSRKRSLPLILIIRDTLGYARTAKEATRIISNSKVKVDHIIRRDRNFPTGLMDVIHIEGIDEIFRVLPKPGRGLSLFPIDSRESEHKLCKIVGKRIIGGGRLQISLHDGRNLTVNPKDFRKGDDEVTVGGAVQLALPSQRVERYVPLKQGSLGLVTDGKNQGMYGKIASISEGSYARPKIAKIETAGDSFETRADYVIPVGTDSPLVALNR